MAGFDRATVREGYDNLNRALAAGADLRPLFEGFDPDLVVEMGVLEGTFLGPEGFVRFLEGQAAIFDDLRCEPKEFIEVGDRWVVPMRLSGRAKSTGLPFAYDAVHVWTVSQGRVTHLRLYDSKERALEDAAAPR